VVSSKSLDIKKSFQTPRNAQALYPKYTPSAGSWSTQGVEVANPVPFLTQSSSPAAKPSSSATNVPSFTVEVTTQRIAAWQRETRGGQTRHRPPAKLMMGRDPFRILSSAIQIFAGAPPCRNGRMGVA
jgi:hypothetical protein